MQKAQQRHKYLTDTARDLGFVSISEAAEHLSVSRETVRRDVNKLVESGALLKVRGGATTAKPTMRRDAVYQKRASSNVDERLSLGKCAAEMITDGAIVGLDCGVCAMSVASAVQDVRGVTFVTNSLPTASILLNKIEHGTLDGRVIFLGGELDTLNRSTRGAMTVSELQKYYFDIAFISCTSINEDSVSSYTLDECFYSAELLRRSSVSVLLALSEKAWKSSLYSYASPTDFDRIIIDDTHKLPPALTEALAGRSTELIVVRGDD